MEIKENIFMRKIIFILLAAVLFCGCCEQGSDIGHVRKQKEVRQVASNYNTTYNVVEIDSCEYLVKHTLIWDDREKERDVISITHKGNCRYCLERNRKMIEDILK